jgi:MscS family membrane protein
MYNLTKRIAIACLRFAFFLALFPSLAVGQLPVPKAPASAPKTQTDPLNRDTPNGTVFGFLEAAQSGNYAIAAQYLQLSSARRQSDGEALAQKLKTAMDVAFAGNLKPSRQPEGTPQEGVPPDRQVLGTMSFGDVDADLELVRVSDPNFGKIWLIASDTLTKIPELYDQVEARQVETRLPKWLVKHQFVGMPWWQWFALLLLIPVAAAAGWILLVVLQVPIRWWAHRHGGSGQELKSVSGPAWLLAGTLIHKILAAYLGMPLLQRHYYAQVIAVAVIVGGNWILWRVIRWFLRGVRSRALARGYGGTGSLMLLGERLVKAFIFLMAVFLVFGVLGFNLNTALAGVGIGTLAIGFGAQQTIANLFGGVSVLGDEVMRVGDVCKFGDRTGTVEDIGLRSTRVRTEERTLLAIPNGTVASINVENFSRRDKILFKTMLALHLDTSQEHVRLVLSEIRGVLSSSKKVESNTIRVRLAELTSSSINVEIVCYVLTRDYDEFAAVREDLLLKIMGFIEDSGTTLASPSQTLYLSSEPGSTKDKSRSDSKEGANSPEQTYPLSTAVADENNEKKAQTRMSADRARLESALSNRTPDDGKNTAKNS